MRLGDGDGGRDEVNVDDAVREDISHCRPGIIINAP